LRQNLIELRESKELSQQDVAELSGIDRSYYSGIETGKRNPSLAIAVEIANTLGVKLDPTGLFTIKDEITDEKPTGRTEDRRERKAKKSKSITKESAGFRSPPVFRDGH
jgi:transcriptional regulator with XRE-family HTH domain